MQVEKPQIMGPVGGEELALEQLLTRKSYTPPHPRAVLSIPEDGGLQTDVLEH